MNKIIKCILGVAIFLLPTFCSSENMKMRDPFFFPGKEDFIDQKYFVNSSPESLISLAGVIEADSGFGAILTKGLRKEVVFTNDMIWGYQVKKVAMDHVVLLKGEKETKVSF